MKRTRTRPDVKWLINEAAVLAGELAHLDEEIARLTQRRASTQKAHAACVRTLSVITGPITNVELPTVRAHRAYGGRGSLRQFLQDTLKSLAPVEMDSNELAFLAIEQFKLTFSSVDELDKFKDNSIASALRILSKEGNVQPVDRRCSGPSVPGKWQWVEATPLLEDLAEQVRAAEGTKNVAQIKRED